MVIRKLLVLFLVLIIFIVPVSAENVSKSGTVDYSYSQSNSYGVSSIDYYGVPDPSYIIHRFTDAKYLDALYVSGMYKRSSGVEYSINAYTTVIGTIDGVFYGSGIAGMIEESSTNVCFDFEFTIINSSLADSLSGVHEIQLSYDSSIFSDVTRKYESFGTNQVATGSSSLTSSEPTGFGASSAHGDVYTYHTTYLSSWYTSYKNDYDYFYNNDTGLSNINISKGSSSSKWNVHNLSGGSYFYESSYNVNDVDQTFIRGEQVHANVTLNVDGGVYVNTVLDLGGYDEEEDEDGEDYFIYNITTELDEYSPGDTVNVTYTTDQKGTIQVVKTISGDIYHSIGFVSGATNATWQFYIAGNEPYGFYDVYLLDSSNSILDSVRYSLLPTTSSLDILQSSVDLHETFVVFAQTVNESILSIEDPNGVEVWNESIGALMYDYIYYTPTIKTGIYTAYLYDDTTLNDTVMVYLADPPIIDDPLDPETNGSIVVEDVLEDDESMTEYFDGKFRKFAPTAWGIFLLSIILWLMAILTSFGGSSKRR
jgi:hypothetical protein